MGNESHFNIAVFAGDGIGHEITEPCLRLLDHCTKKTGGLELHFEHLAAGAAAYQETGEALPGASVQRARKADAILLAAMGDPTVRYPDGTELIPQVDLRMELALYAGLRPIRSIPGVYTPLRDKRVDNIDFVLVRESIEGLFAPSTPGTKSANEATETLLITRDVSTRLFKRTFALAQRRKQQGKPGRVTCVDKANVFGAFALFREIFYEVAKSEAESLTTDHAYVDAMAMWMISRPWEYDVLVTENMFGDILSDLGAALIGGMGYAPSADIGDDHAVFQPCHGSAPDIAGRGIANPTAMFLSAAMMLDWLGEKHQCPAAIQAASSLSDAVDDAFRAGTLQTCEMGGNAGVQAVTDAVIDALDAQ